MSLTYGTLRYHLAKLTHGADLLAGRPAVVTSAQLRMFGEHPDKPTEAELDATVTWTLTGYSTLTPVA